jgi:hypothetical protein
LCRLPRSCNSDRQASFVEGSRHQRKRKNRNQSPLGTTSESRQTVSRWQIGSEIEFSLLYAKGLTSGEISEHYTGVYGVSMSKETISRITDKVIEEMNNWANRPLDGICRSGIRG